MWTKPVHLKEGNKKEKERKRGGQGEGEREEETRERERERERRNKKEKGWKANKHMLKIRQYTMLSIILINNYCKNYM